MLYIKGRRFGPKPSMSLINKRKAQRTRPFLLRLNKMTRARPLRMPMPIGSGKMPFIKLPAQRRLSLRRGNMNLSRANAERKRVRGFRVSKFLLQTHHLAASTDAAFDNSTIIPTLLTITQLNPYSSNNLTPGNTHWNGGNVQLQNFLFIIATWPGSNLAGADQVKQGTGGLSNPRFGLMQANQSQSNNNYNWNTRAVENVLPLFSNTVLTADKLDLIFRKLIVYSSTLRIELKNTMQFQGLKVHFVHFQIKSYSVQLADGTCSAQSNLNTMFNLFIDGKTSELDRTITRQNWTECIKSRKLPASNFITKSWKTVTLGRPAVYNNTTINNYPESSPIKTVTFKYGKKEWRRTGCQEEGALFKDDVLGESLLTQKLTLLGIFHELDGKFTFGSASNLTTLLDMRIVKTNVWREFN